MFKRSFMIWEVYAVLQHSTSKTGLCCTCLHRVFWVFCFWAIIVRYFLLDNADFLEVELGIHFCIRKKAFTTV